MAGITHLPDSPDQLEAALRQVPFETDLQRNLNRIRHLFAGTADLITYPVVPGSGPRGCLIYIDGLVDKQLIDQHILAPVAQLGSLPPPTSQATGVTSRADLRPVNTLADAVQAITGGDTVLLIDGADQALVYGVRGWEARSIAEPATEELIRGPRDGFVETIRTNTALLRRRIRSPYLRLESLTIGRLTQTTVHIAYIHGVADNRVVAEVRRRLGRIDTDGILESGYLEQFIEDSPLSPFPQVQNTERPDTAAAALLEGRVAILVDSTPFVLLVPVVLSQFLQAGEDYYERFLIGSAIRLMRYLFLGIALTLPSLYIAISTFQQEVLPTDLLLTIASAREEVPFPALVEALVMEVAFEILREAGVRLPRQVGQAVSIVGALVVGEAAVQAGIVSPAMVIVVATTGISSFAIPRYSWGIAIRMLRFPLMILSGTLGLFGLVAGLTAILLHLCSLRSFGVPYLSPLVPLDWQSMKDTLIRAPLWWQRYRPQYLSRARRRMRGWLHPGPGTPPGGRSS